MSKTLPIIIAIILISLIMAITHCTKLQPTNSPSNVTLQKSIFITQTNNSSYFYYNILTQNNQIIIKILNKDLTVQTFIFAKINCKVEFRDAYDRYIIVQQINTKKNVSISYWVIKITTNKVGHSLSSFAVNSIFDSDGFMFQNLYSLTQIIEYDQTNELLYVIMDSKSDFNIYKIDMNKKNSTIKKMQIIGWFIYSKIRRETIVGGNSKVLIDATNDQLWIDQNTNISINQSSTYKKYNIEDLTSLRISPCGSQSYNLRNSYFQYISLSMDRLKMTTFIYHGYNKTTPIGQGQLISNKKPIKIYSDDENYFLAVADNDIYYTIVYWNNMVNDYVVYSKNLKETVKNKKQWKEYVNSFSQALIIVLYRMKFYILTEKALYVENGMGITKIELENKLQKTDKLQRVLFTYMLKYEKMQNHAEKNSEQ